MNFSGKLLFGLIVLLGMSASEKLGAKKISIDYQCSGMANFLHGQIDTAYPICLQVGTEIEFCDYDGSCEGITKYRKYTNGKPDRWIDCCPRPHYMDPQPHFENK